MDPLTKSAIAGTSKESPPPRGGLPVDDLFERVMSLEKNLLLRAGARSVYRIAGHPTEAGVEAPRPAPAETLPACSAKAAELMSRLFAGKRDDILLEALERLRLAELHLPHMLLPDALNIERKELRPAVLAVIGERGRWLAGFNPAWVWAIASEGDAPENDDEAAWREGVLEERTSALRRVRRQDAGSGLRWVEEVWKTEKADVRVAMLGTLEVGLKGTDEPFLESALGDRSVKVRAVTADMLARLPDSAYVRRNAERADTIIAGYEPPSTDFLGRRRPGRLKVEPPPVVDEGWKRELPGEASPPRRIGEKAWTIVRTLEIVSPVHWERRFGTTPEELVTAARGGEWEAVLLTGWRRAAVRHGEKSWAWPLWRRWHEAPETQHDLTSTWELPGLLASLLPHVELGRLLRSSGMSYELAYTFAALPGPWDEELSLLYLEELRKHVPRIFARNRDVNDPWLGTPQPAAERMPVSCLEQASVPQPDEVLTEREFSDGQVLRYEILPLRYWRETLTKFEETLELRRRLVKEIPL